MKRVVALDVGEKRIGVAVSDPLGFTAQGVETIESRGIERDLSRVAQIMGEYQTDWVLCGLPRSMDGSTGFQAERIGVFGQRLKDMGFAVAYWDERLTTAAARRTLIEADVSRKKRKQVIDKLAASYILQGFLDSGRSFESIL